MDELKYKNLKICQMMKLIYCNLKPLETCLDKSKVCDMAVISGAFDKSVFDGNTILPKISEENDKHK